MASPARSSSACTRSSRTTRRSLPRRTRSPPDAGETMDPADKAGESLLTFPTVFPIKIMGRREDGFAQTMSDIVLKHAPDFHPQTMEMRSSKNGRYLSLTVTINARSRDQLDGLYSELSKHPMVVMVL